MCLAGPGARWPQACCWEGRSQAQGAQDGSPRANPRSRAWSESSGTSRERGPGPGPRAAGGQCVSPVPVLKPCPPAWLGVETGL